MTSGRPRLTNIGLYGKCWTAGSNPNHECVRVHHYPYTLMIGVRIVVGPFIP